MEFTPTYLVANINSTSMEIRMYRILQELLTIETNSEKNQSNLDNISSERDEQTGEVNATIVLPCHINLSSGILSIEIINPYTTTSNVNQAFFETVFTQWLMEQDITHNPSQAKYISIEQTYNPRENRDEGGSNGTITITLNNLPTTTTMENDIIKIQASEYLVGN